MIPMVTDMVIIHMAHKATGSLTTLTAGKTLTKMATLMKMMRSSMMQPNGTTAMVMVMVMRLMVIEQMNFLRIH